MRLRLSHPFEAGVRAGLFFLRTLTSACGVRCLRRAGWTVVDGVNGRPLPGWTLVETVDCLPQSGWRVVETVDCLPQSGWRVVDVVRTRGGRSLTPSTDVRTDFTLLSSSAAAFPP